jgi:pumilio RNA-binding family
VRHAGNNSNTAALAAAAANAAIPKSGDPMKIATPSTAKAKPPTTPGNSSIGETFHSSIDAYDTASTPMADSPTYGFGGVPGMPPPGMPPYTPPGYPGAPPPNPFVDQLMSMGKGMPMYPGMMPGMMPGMPMMMPGMMPGMMPHMAMGMNGMMPPMQGGGKNNSKDQGKEKRRRPARKKNAKDKDDGNEVDESLIPKSKELQEVRNAGQGKCRLTLLDELNAEKVCEFAMDQHGSRFLQSCLDDGSTDQAQKTKVLEAILPQIKALAKDQYGNFVIQKLFEVITDKKAIADQLDGEVVGLSMDVHGCRVIQKALQLLPRDAQTKLADELKDKSAGTDQVAECINNMHGNHVIQKCIEQMPPDSVNFIIDSVKDNVEVMAKHMYGCRIIQRLLEHCAPHQLQDMLEKIMRLIQQKELVSHPFGNYVVQHMLEHGRPEDKKRILEVVTNSIFEFSTQKCSSNVVEKCFEIASIGEHADSLKDERRNLYNAVLLPGNPQTFEYPIRKLTDDKFGNYIVQRMMEYSRDQERALLLSQLSALVPILQNSTNGKHICSALEKDFKISTTAPNEQ